MKIRETPIKIDDLGGKTHYFWKHPHGAVSFREGIFLFSWLTCLVLCFDSRMGEMLEVLSEARLDTPNRTGYTQPSRLDG